MYRRLRKLIKLPFREKLSLAEAFFLLGIGRAIALKDPIHKIKRRVESSPCTNKRKAFGEIADNMVYKAEVNMVKWSVAIMSRYTFWNSNCFAQALAAYMMLKRRGIPSTMYFGLAKEAEGKMIAHAWLMNKDTLVTGEKEWKRFHTVMHIGCE